MMLILFISLSSLLFGEVSKEELLGKINPAQHVDFVKIESNGKTFYLRKEVAKKLQEMINEAKKDGLDLKIVSAYRSYETQRMIWERKIKNFSKGRKNKREAVKQVLKYSSMPGTSRHHWGTDVDLVSLEPSFYEKPEGEKIMLWLSSNASKFGFFMPYSSERKNKNGYKDEKWHWSYRPIASKFLSNYINLVNYEDLKDFTGCEFARELEIFSNYIMNVSD